MRCLEVIKMEILRVDVSWKFTSERILFLLALIPETTESLRGLRCCSRAAVARPRPSPQTDRQTRRIISSEKKVPSPASN